ncbi:hypothetical protein [Kitasatospora sp. MY 5-36]|uniref:hypothetical protein n=1 Tax=Kitasatospora sp. MY 5-36 TaxID=1678027 RepID=UPI000670C6B9|nr:hypothetical protein [Kitasatospora sp. MY 5-36]
MDLHLLSPVPVPAGLLLAGLAAPYLTNTVRILTRRPRPADRGARLLSTAPGLGMVAGVATIWSPYLADDVPLPSGPAAVAAVYLLGACVSSWRMPAQPSPARRAAYHRLVTPHAWMVVGTGLLTASYLATGLITALSGM